MNQKHKCKVHKTSIKIQDKNPDMDHFSQILHQSMAHKRKNGKLNITIKIFYCLKDTINKMKK